MFLSENKKLRMVRILKDPGSARNFRKLQLVGKNLVEELIGGLLKWN